MHIVKHPFIRLVIVVFSLILCVGLVRSIYSHFTREDTVGERNITLEQEKKRYLELTQKLKVATSEAFVEEQARNKLGLVKEGDTVILLDTSQAPPGGRGEGEKELSNWQKWWRLFF